MESSFGIGRCTRPPPRPLRVRWREWLRRLDKRLKRAAIDALSSAMRGRTHDVPIWTARPHRVLYLRYDRIGDMVLATGIIRAIVAAQPTVTVDVLASRRNADVLRGNPSVGKVHTIDKSRPWTFLTALARIRRARYDAVLDAMVMTSSLTAMLLMWASGARHRIGVGGRGNDTALTLPVARLPGAVHYVEHSASLLAAFGADRQASAADPRPGEWRPELFLSPAELSEGEDCWRQLERDVAAEREPPILRIVVNVSAGDGARYWPEERFIAVLRRMRHRFASTSVIVVGTPLDDERMRRIAEGARARASYTAHFRQMMAIVAASDLVLTSDTSVTHIASAFARPVLAMFSAGGGALYGPYATAGCTVSTPGPTLESLELEPVWQRLEEMIAALVSVSTRREHRERAHSQECCTARGALPAGSLRDRRLSTNLTMPMRSRTAATPDP